MRIPYGAEHIRHALQLGQSISYRFKRNAKGWRVFVSTSEIAVDQIQIGTSEPSASI